MHVQIAGDHAGCVKFRNWERRVVGGYTPWIAAPDATADRAKLRREAVRRGDRQRVALRKAFEGEG